MRLQAGQHRQDDTTRPRAKAPEEAGFRLQSRCRVNRPSPQRQKTDWLELQSGTAAARVTPRSHPTGGRQPRATRRQCGGHRPPRSRSSTPSGARGSLAASQPPRWTHPRVPFVTLNRPQRRVAALQPPPSSHAPSRRLRCPRLTPYPCSSSTTHSRGLPQPAALCSKEASQSSPALEARPRAGAAATLEVVGPEVSRRSAWTIDPASACRWALLEARRGRRSPGRYLMPRSRSRYHVSKRCSTPRAVVLALMGSLLALAHTLDTALDIRSGVDPCEWMALRIQD